MHRYRWKVEYFVSTSSRLCLTEIVHTQKRTTNIYKCQSPSPLCTPPLSFNLPDNPLPALDPAPLPEAFDPAKAGPECREGAGASASMARLRGARLALRPGGTSSAYLADACGLGLGLSAKTPGEKTVFGWIVSGQLLCACCCTNRTMTHQGAEHWVFFKVVAW